MDKIIKPFIKITPDAKLINRAQISFEPLTPGFGTTLAHALRRSLLDALRGIAITSVKFSNTHYAFASIDGVYEDMQVMLANISKIVVDFDHPECEVINMKLNVERSGDYYASDIETGSAKIINGDQYLFNVSSDDIEPFSIDINAAFGHGYLPAQSNQVSSEISLDAYFSPIVNVSYSVHDARVGHSTDYDKLLLDITTNGSIKPERALVDATQYLYKYFDALLNQICVQIGQPSNATAVIDDNLYYQDENNYPLQNEYNSEELDEKAFDPRFLMTIDELDLSIRSENCLRNDGMLYVGDLVQRAESDMLSIANFGRKSLDEIKAALEKHSLKFEMHIENWPPKGYKNEA